MTKMSDDEVGALHHHIVEEAKQRWDGGRAGRPFVEILREVAVDQPAVRRGAIAAEIVSGPGQAWRLTLRIIISGTPRK